MEDALGPLMDPRNFMDDALDELKEPYSPSTVGTSPASARGVGAQVSGRVICATTQLSHVLVFNDKRELRLRQRRGRSSLQGALDVLNRSEWEPIFVGWTGELETETGKTWEETPTDKEKHEALRLYSESSKSRVVPIWANNNAREYAEHTIWPIFHYIHTLDVRVLSSQSEDGFAFYEQYNRAYAEAIAAIYKPGDIIWIHDYYLLLLPGMLRQLLGPNATIGLFLHCSFPSSEFVRSIPQRLQLLEGMLGSTICGFQSNNYARHFVSTCIRVLGNDHSGRNIVHQGRIVQVVVQHIGLDVDTVVRETKREQSREICREISKMHEGVKIIIGRDKLDNAQGVIQKLHAYSMFLEYYPEWRGKAVLIQITTPSFNEDAKAEKQIAELIADINGTYGDMQWWPVQHHSQYINQIEYYALLETASLGLFTSIRDSTCYAALEYVACQRKRQNPLVISEFMGVADTLQEAIKVNPYNPAGVAETINAYLVDPSQTKSDYEWTRKYSVEVWVNTFMSRLVTHELRHESQHHTPDLDLDLLRKTYSEAEKRLFLFDYDGTLTPIVRDPAAAVPSSQLKSILKRLTADDKNEVWIISGRDQAFLDEHMGCYAVNLSAEHGCFTKPAGGEWIDLAAQMDNSWKQIVLEVMQAYTERTQGAVIEQKKQAITWHYRRADPVFGAFQAGHLRAYLENSIANSYPVDVMSGKANVEVRPRMFNKGEIVRNVFREQNKPPGFVFCAGDDTTDEDMFRAVNDQDNRAHYFSVSIGESSKLTVANYHIASPELVLDALDQLK